MKFIVLLFQGRGIIVLKLLSLWRNSSLAIHLVYRAPARGADHGSWTQDKSSLAARLAVLEKIQRRQRFTLDLLDCLG